MTSFVKTLEWITALLLAPALFIAGMAAFPAHVVWRRRRSILLVSFTALLFAILGWVAIERKARPASSAIARSRPAGPARPDQQVRHGAS